MFNKKTAFSSWTESVLISNDWIKSRQWKFKVDTKNSKISIISSQDLDSALEDCEDENWPKRNESLWSHKNHGETAQEKAI